MATSKKDLINQEVKFLKDEKAVLKSLEGSPNLSAAASSQIQTDIALIDQQIDVAKSETGLSSAEILSNEQTFLGEQQTLLADLQSVTHGAVKDAVTNEIGAVGQQMQIVTQEAACYLRGTRITTERGPVAIEDLQLGDRLLTASGKLRPIIWLGHRGFDLDAHPHPRPAQVWPVLVRAGAFSEGLPQRDLWLSPGHNVLVKGGLYPIESLANGATILRQPRSQFEYWHVELDEHDIIFAEGLPAESYLDTGNRTAFVDGGAFIEQHPDFSTKHWADTCVPLVHEGPRLAMTRAALLKRAESFGYTVTDDADMHVIADGKRIDPIDLGERRFAFVLPQGSRDLRLASRTFVPAETEAASRDKRTLGVCVGELQVNGKAVDLDADKAFGAGWGPSEVRGDGGRRRWTAGDAALPAGAKLVVMTLAARGSYRAWEDERVVALFG